MFRLSFFLLLWAGTAYAQEPPTCPQTTEGYGDGSDGYQHVGESNGVLSVEDCMAEVLKAYPDASGMTWQEDFANCYADLGNVQGILQGDGVMCVFSKGTEQDSCSGGFNMVADTHSEGGVCAGEDIVDLEECLCSCQNEESCSAVDWNKSDNPYKGCRCWLLSGENELAPKTNMRLDQWTKQTNGNPEIAAEESGPACDIVFGYGHNVDSTVKQKTFVGIDVESAEECASRVFTQYPEATSMTYYGNSKECYADFGTDHIYDYDGEDYAEYSCMNPELFPEQRVEFY